MVEKGKESFSSLAGNFRGSAGLADRLVGSERREICDMPVVGGRAWVRKALFGELQTQDISVVDPALDRQIARRVLRIQESKSASRLH